MREIAVIAVLLLAGCAVKAEHFVGPNSRPAYSMKCSGMGITLDDCFKKAGEVCPTGYNIIDRSTGTVCYGNACGLKQSLAIECK